MSRRRINIVIKKHSITENFQLKDNQISHVENIKNVLATNPFYMDTSDTGTGKTAVACSVAKALGLKLLVISPLTVRKVWKEFCERFGFELVDTVSYSTLRGVTNRKINHPYLDRVEVLAKGSKGRKAEFSPTDYLYNLLTEGLLVVFDECQAVKNKKAVQTEAVNCICNLIISMKGKSRFALLSATPIHKVENYMSLMSITGLFSNESLYHGNNKLNYYVVSKMMETCRGVSPDVMDSMEEILGKPTQGNIRDYIEQIVRKVLKPNFFFSMPPFEDKVYKKIMINGFYIMDKRDEEALTKNVQGLLRSTRYKDGEVSNDISDFTEITKYRRLIELSKINLYRRLIINTLNNVKNSKIAVFVEFNDTINGIVEAMVDSSHELIDTFDIKVLTGATSDKKKRNESKSEREEVVEAFNNDSCCRLLIMNTSVGGIGLSLHDTKGNSPRYSYISPTYSLITAHQAAGRNYRVGVKSDAHVSFIYGKGAATEKCILNSLARKRSILNGVLNDEVSSFIKFPDQYDEYIEERDDEDNEQDNQSSQNSSTNNSQSNSPLSPSRPFTPLNDQ